MTPEQRMQQKERRYRRSDAGMCADCNAPRISAKHCAAHRDAQNARANARAARRGAVPRGPYRCRRCGGLGHLAKTCASREIP